MVAVFLGNVGTARQILGFFSVCLGLGSGCGPDLLAGMAEGLRQVNVCSIICQQKYKLRYLLEILFFYHLFENIQYHQIQTISL